MYIFEIIAKLIKNRKNKEIKSSFSVVDYEEVCSHSFYPLDSTGELLACSKCGIIKKNSEMVVKTRNPFV